MRDVSNLSDGRVRRSAILLVPLSLAILGMAGVTAPPALELSHARSSVEAARSRAERIEHEAARFDAFQRANAEERVSAALASLRGDLPSGLSDLDVHAAVRLACELRRVDLAHLKVGALPPTELDGLEDQVLLRPVELGGRGRVDDFFGVLATLRSLGAAVGVRELSLDSIPGSSRFEIYATLAFHQREPLTEGQRASQLGSGDMP